VAWIAARADPEATAVVGRCVALGARSYLPARTCPLVLARAQPLFPCTVPRLRRPYRPPSLLSLAPLDARGEGSCLEPTGRAPSRLYIRECWARSVVAHVTEISSDLFTVV